MNQFDIEEELDRLEKQAITKVDKLFNARLKELLIQLSELFAKYGNNPNASVYTEVNRYNRFKKETQRIAEGMGETYSEVLKDLEKMNDTLYTEKLLLLGYLTTQFLAAEEEEPFAFSLPSQAVIDAALVNPLELLTLPNVLKRDREQVVYRITLQLSLGLQAGEGYAQIARRLEEAVGFGKNRARTVARTEGGRVRSQANVDLEESRVGKRSNLTKIWASALDLRVRSAHRKLDGKEADKNGEWKYGANVAKGPLLWIGPQNSSLTINCRCVTIYKVDGKIPEVRRGKDYNDPSYQKKLQERVQKYHDEGMPFGQAINKASKEIQPPSKTFPYIPYSEWKKQYT